MNALRNLLQLVALLLFCCLPALAQSPGRDTKRFNKDGLSFSYPARWSLLDSGNDEARKLLLESGNSEASLMLIIHRDRVLAEKWAQAREDVAFSYVAITFKQYEESGGNPELSPGSLNIGRSRAEGMIIRAKVLDEPHTTEIYWALINQRVVVLMFGGPDKDRRKATPAWHTVRNSIQFAGQKPATKPRRKRRQ